MNLQVGGLNPKPLNPKPLNPKAMNLQVGVVGLLLVPSENLAEAYRGSPKIGGPKLSTPNSGILNV